VSTYIANRLEVTQPPTIFFYYLKFLWLHIKADKTVAQKKKVSERLPTPKSKTRMRISPNSQE